MCAKEEGLQKKDILVLKNSQFVCKTKDRNQEYFNFFRLV